MTFAPAPKRAPESPSFDLIQAVDDALSNHAGPPPVEVAGFFGHPDANKVVWMLESAGYAVEFPYRDGGDCARISW